MNPRNKQYLDALLQTERDGGYTTSIYAVYQEIARLALQAGEVKADGFKASADFIYTKADCFDFVLPGFIFLMTRFGSDKNLPAPLAAEAKKLILDCKYWIDEGGYEKSPCYFTENHQMLFHSCEYAAGRLYPDEVFSNNGMTGREHEAHARPMLLRWLEWRFRFGFCEWLSNTYYHEDFLSLALVMACGDAEVKTRAQMIADQLFYDMAVNSFKGVFGCTHGRSYCPNMCAPVDNCANLRRLYLGSAVGTDTLSAAAVLLAVSDYESAPVVRAIAADTGTVEHRQRMSLRPEQGAALGVDPADPENVTFYWGMQAFSHRLVVDNTLSVKCNPGYYLMERARAYKENFLLCDAANAPTRDDCDYTSMPQADLYTYKTPDYLLSAAQDYKKGYFGFQQHIWQATLGGQAVVFTTHPGTSEYGSRPNRWAGNRILPKAAAYRNVLVCLYNTDVNLVPDFTHSTHAYFPRCFMDEFCEKDGWVFGRKGEAYVALRALSGNGVWVAPDPEFLPTMGLDKEKDKDIAPYELSAGGRSNVWICELGSRRENGTFAAFTQQIAGAVAEGDVFGMRYVSPSLGEMTVGWNLPLTVNGEKIALRDYDRYDDCYGVTPAGARRMALSHGGHSLRLDWENGLRQAD